MRFRIVINSVCSFAISTDKLAFDQTPEEVRAAAADLLHPGLLRPL